VLYAGLFGFHDKPYFAATPGSETPPKVQFDFGKQGSTAPPAAEKQ
jgi:LemA protein